MSDTPDLSRRELVRRGTDELALVSSAIVARGLRDIARIEQPKGVSPTIMPARGPKQQRRIVVARKGSADFRSIQLAIDNASPGDEVVVKPGVYREALVLDKPLSLLGDGNVLDIIIECVKAPCLHLQADRAVVKGMSFRGLAVVDDETLRGAIVVSGGELRIEDCNVQALATCLIVFGNTAVVQLCGARFTVRVAVFMSFKMAEQPLMTATSSLVAYPSEKKVMRSLAGAEYMALQASVLPSEGKAAQ